MAGSIAARVTTKLGKVLGHHGFEVVGRFQLSRPGDYVTQFVEIQQGAGHRASMVSPNICWQVSADGMEDRRTYDLVANLGLLRTSSELWIDCRSGHDVQVAAERINDFVVDVGLPFLDKYRDVNAMIEAYEESVKSTSDIASPFSPGLFFGVDAGWRHYKLGFAYKHIGDLVSARRHFETVVDHYSGASYKWVQERKSQCLEAMAMLTA